MSLSFNIIIVNDNSLQERKGKIMIKLTTLTATSVYILNYTAEKAQQLMTDKEWKKFTKNNKLIIRGKDTTKIWEVC